MIPRFETHYDRANRNPLLQGCYDALRDLKAMCDNPSEDYYQSGMIRADEVWEALEPLRKLVFEVDGTATSAKLDALNKKSPSEIVARIIAQEKKMREEIVASWNLEGE